MNRIIAEIVGAVVIAGTVYLVMHFQKAPEPAHEGNKPKVLDAVPIQEIKPAKVIVYAPAAKVKTNIPDPDKSDPHAFVIGSTAIAASEQPQIATSVFNFNTGETKTYVSKEPAPLIQIEKKYEIKASYGMKTGSGIITRISFSDDFIQLRSFHLGANSSIDSDGEGFIGVHAAYRF